MSFLVCPKMKIMRSAIEEATFFDLPYPIVSYILSCLPTKSILSCKLMCKLWRSIIKDSQFDKSSKSITMIIRPVMTNHANMNLHFVEPEVDFTERIRNGQPCLLLGKEAVISFNGVRFYCLPVECLNMVNSCKGLVCLEIKRGYSNNEGEKLINELGFELYFICNPVTSDYVAVRYPRAEVYGHVGFGFCSKSGRYKLLRFFKNRNKSDSLGRWLLEVDVCTVGGGDDVEWRRVKDCLPQGFWGLQKGMFFGGALHWIVRQLNVPPNIVVAFNCQEENFVQMNLPPGEDRFLVRRGFGLTTLHSRLCFFINVSDVCCNVWIMNEYGVKESWSKLFVISAGECCINNRIMPLKPLAYLNNGEVLMQSLNGELVAYNVTSNTWRAIKIPKVAAKVEVMLLDPVFIPTKDRLMQGIEPDARVPE